MENPMSKHVGRWGGLSVAITAITVIAVVGCKDQITEVKARTSARDCGDPVIARRRHLDLSADSGAAAAGVQKKGAMIATTDCGDPGGGGGDPGGGGGGGESYLFNDRVGVQGTLHEPIQDKDAAAIANAQLTGNVGAKWVRFGIGWAQLQPNGPGSLGDLSVYDRELKALTDRGMIPYLVVNNSPLWAQLCDEQGHRTVDDNGVQRHCATERMPDGSTRPWSYNSAPDPAMYAWWRDFMSLLVHHFDGNGGRPLVTHWGIWNEPNDPGFFFADTSVIDPIVAYKLLVEYAADAVHSIPGNKVVAPELAAHGFSNGYFCTWGFCVGPQNHPDREWLDQFVYYGGWKTDIISVHGYSDDPHRMQDRIYNEYIHNTRLWYTSHPIWLTEFGRLSPTNNDGVQASHLRHVYQDMFTGPAGGRWAKSFYFLLAEPPGNPQNTYNEGSIPALTLVKWAQSTSPLQVNRDGYYCLQRIAWGMDWMNPVYWCHQEYTF
jgi:hypothetical protein